MRAEIAISIPEGRIVGINGATRGKEGSDARFLLQCYATHGCADGLRSYPAARCKIYQFLVCHHEGLAAASAPD